MNPVEEAFPDHEVEELETPRAAKLLSVNIWEMEHQDREREQRDRDKQEQERVQTRAAVAPPLIKMVPPVRKRPLIRSPMSQVCFPPLSQLSAHQLQHACVSTCM